MPAQRHSSRSSRSSLTMACAAVYAGTVLAAISAKYSAQHCVRLSVAIDVPGSRQPSNAAEQRRSFTTMQSGGVPLHCKSKERDPTNWKASQTIYTMEGILADAQQLLVDERFSEYAPSATPLCHFCLTNCFACVNPLACASSIKNRTIAARYVHLPSACPRLWARDACCTW